MAIFPNVETEEVVQVSDKTRIDATKSFVDTGTGIAVVKIKPGKNATEVTITSPTASNWKLDTQFDFTVDVDATNNKLDFKEGAGAELTATISTGNYTMAALAAEIKTQLDVAGALTYTVTVTDALLVPVKFTIAATGEFSLLPVTGTNILVDIFSHIGFIADKEGEVTYTSEEVETVVKQITVSANIGAGDTVITHDMLVISATSDRLWSTDPMLKTHEPRILKWAVAGRNTFKDVHRLAQTQMLAWMDKEGFIDVFHDKYTKQRVILPEEFEQWSKFTTLALIFDGLSDKEDDFFFKKARRYQGKGKFFRDRAVVRIDIDQDGDVETHEQIDITHATVKRR